MEIFKAVAEAGKFTRAAENMGLSKSAVSHAIADLESYLGTQLINRDNRQFQLTVDGELYYEQCSHFLSELNAIENSYREDRPQIDGHISLTAPITFGVTQLTPRLSDFMLQNPDISISLSLSEHNLDLVQAGLDMAIRIGHLQNSALRARRIATCNMLLCASPKFISENRKIEDIHDLNNLNTLRYRWTPKWNFIKSGDRFTFTPKGTIMSDSGDSLVELAARGHGVCFMPEFIALPALQTGRLVRILPDYVGVRLPIHIVFPPGRHRPTRIKKLTDHLIAGFEDFKY